VGTKTETPKSWSNHLSQVTSVIARAIARNSAFALKQDTTVCFLVFQAMREPPRKYSRQRERESDVQRGR
jgi:hypothetical protein